MAVFERTHPMIFGGFVVTAVWLLDSDLLHAADKAPVPSADAQNAALALVKDVYGEEYTNAESSEQKTAVAQKLLQTAKGTTQGTANHYALLRVAWDVATQAGDAKIAMQIAEAITSVYEVNALNAKVATVKTAAGFVRSSTQNSELATVALEMVDEAVASDDYNSATELTGIALAAARKAQDWQLVKRIVAQDKAIEQMAEAYARARKALVTLENDPANSEANQVAGEYFCFVKADWEKGIPMLALGSDEGLKALAVKELRGANSAQEQVALGDAWWDNAQTKADPAKESLMLRAGFWYRQAEPDLGTGLTQVKIERRLAELAALGREEPESPERPPKRVTKKEPRLVPGLVLRLFPMQQVQDDNRYLAHVMPSEFGQPVGPALVIPTSEYKHNKATNAIAFGYLKINVEGDYAFHTRTDFDRGAMYLNAKAENPFRDGELKRATVHLEPGMVPIAIVAWTIFDHVHTYWMPPGAIEPTLIPTPFLFHDPNQPVPLVVEKPDGKGHLPKETAPPK